MTMQLTSPYAYDGKNLVSNSYVNYGGPPTDFSADASGMGVQPSIDSTIWKNLLVVKGFTPPLVRGTSGVFSHAFHILPQDGSPSSEGNPLQDLSVSLNDPIGTNLSIDVGDAFPPQRTCCPTFTASIRAADGTVRALPPWLSLTYSIMPDATPPFEDYQPPQPAVDTVVALKLTSYPGNQAVGSYTILITASSAEQPPRQTTKSFTLKVLGAGPTVPNPVPVVEVADGQSLNYTIPSNTFQLNKPYGSLDLSATLQGGGALPAWLNISASGGSLFLAGAPSLGSDQSYQLNISASDSDGAKNSTILRLEVRAACPPGLFRHFRVLMQPANKPAYWGLYNYYPARSLICSLTWSSPANGSELVAFPTLDLPAANISGTTYQAGDYGDRSAGPESAFQHTLDNCGDGYYDDQRQTWKACLLGSCAYGIFQHTFPILPLTQPTASAAIGASAPGPSLSLGPSADPALAPGLANLLAPSASRRLLQAASSSLSSSSLNVSLADPVGTIYPLDVDGVFVQQTRIYPPNITAAFKAASGPVQPLPGWLAFSWNVSMSRSLTNRYQPTYQRFFESTCALTLQRWPGLEAIAQDTIVLTATDRSSAHPPPQVASLTLNVAVAGPLPFSPIPVVEVEDGQPLSFTIPNDTFQINTPSDTVLYTASLRSPDSTETSLPDWLSFDSGETRFSGTPNLGQDAHYAIVITIADAQGGSTSSTLNLYVRAQCPTGLFRHFRMRLSANNDDGRYQLTRPYSWNPPKKRSALCILDIANDIPTPSRGFGGSTFNTSGTRYEGGDACSYDPPADPPSAFQDVGASYGCRYYGTWKGVAGDWVAIDYGLAGCQPIPQNFSITAPYDLISYSSLGPPSDFVLSAASSGLQPKLDASTWKPILSVSNFKPAIPAPPATCISDNRGCPSGTFQHTFIIPQVNASVPQPSPPSILKTLPAVRAETGMPQDLHISLDGVFQLGSSTCCANISVSLANYTSDAPSTPLAPMRAPAAAPAAPISETGVLVLPPAPATAFAAGPDPSQNASLTFVALPSWLSYTFNMTDVGPLKASWTSWNGDVYEYTVSERYDGLNTLTVSNAVEVADLGQYLIRIAGTDLSNGLTTYTYLTLSIQDYYQLRAQVQLVGISAAQFDEAAQQAFRQGIANVLGVTLDQVMIVGVTDVPVSGRRLQQEGQTALKVDFSVQGIKSQAAAGTLATNIADIVSSGALDTTLQNLGLPVAATLTVAPTVTQTPTIAAVDSPPPPPPASAPPPPLPPGAPPVPIVLSPPVPLQYLPPGVADAPAPDLVTAGLSGAPKATATGPSSNTSPQGSSIRLNATFSLAAFTVDSFNTSAQDSFRGAIAAAALKIYHTVVVTSITDIRAGSIFVNASLLFLSSSADIVNHFTSDLQNNPSSIFPSSQFGDVRAVSFNGDIVRAQSVPPSPPMAAAPTSWYTSGRIAGIVVGSALGMVLIAAAIMIIAWSRHRAARNKRSTAGADRGSERSALM
ncbi:hypothetical protein WJX74_000101 [Apatococcus lobatus]|uniref:Dystroglycan-type cadherin-like domain-containing protein n=1 Tax=Apatococcus lobatus TaxID=904363 RepID=A0AAW1RRZ4_9CHLO